MPVLAPQDSLIHRRLAEDLVAGDLSAGALLFDLRADAVDLFLCDDAFFDQELGEAALIQRFALPGGAGFQRQLLLLADAQIDLFACCQAPVDNELAEQCVGAGLFIFGCFRHAMRFDRVSAT